MSLLLLLSSLVWDLKGVFSILVSLGGVANSKLVKHLISDRGRNLRNKVILVSWGWRLALFGSANHECILRCFCKRVEGRSAVRTDYVLVCVDLKLVLLILHILKHEGVLETVLGQILLVEHVLLLLLNVEVASEHVGGRRDERSLTLPLGSVEEVQLHAACHRVTRRKPSQLGSLLEACFQTNFHVLVVFLGILLEQVLERFLGLVFLLFVVGGRVRFCLRRLSYQHY